MVLMYSVILLLLLLNLHLLKILDLLFNTQVLRYLDDLFSLLLVPSLLPILHILRARKSVLLPRKKGLIIWIDMRNTVRHFIAGYWPNSIIRQHVPPEADYFVVFQVFDQAFRRVLYFDEFFKQLFAAVSYSVAFNWRFRIGANHIWKLLTFLILARLVVLPLKKSRQFSLCRAVAIH